MPAPRFRKIDGVWFRVFTDDRGRARRIRATEAELRRAGIEQDGPSDSSSRPSQPADAGNKGAAPAPASDSPAEEDDAPEDGERGTERASDSDSPASLALWIAGAGLTLIAVTTIGAFLLLGPGRRREEDELEAGNTDLEDGAEPRQLQAVP